MSDEDAPTDVDRVMLEALAALTVMPTDEEAALDDDAVDPPPAERAELPGAPAEPPRLLVESAEPAPLPIDPADLPLLAADAADAGRDEASGQTKRGHLHGSCGVELSFTHSGFGCAQIGGAHVEREEDRELPPIAEPPLRPDPPLPWDALDALLDEDCVHGETEPPPDAAADADEPPPSCASKRSKKAASGSAEDSGDSTPSRSAARSGPTADGPRDISTDARPAAYGGGISTAIMLSGSFISPRMQKYQFAPGVPTGYGIGGQTAPGSWHSGLHLVVPPGLTCTTRHPGFLELAGFLEEDDRTEEDWTDDDWSEEDGCEDDDKDEDEAELAHGSELTLLEVGQRPQLPSQPGA